MPAGSNFVNVRFVAEGELTVTGQSEDPEQIEAIHLSIAAVPDVASAAITAALTATGELIAAEAQHLHAFDGPVATVWPTTVRYEPSKFDFSPGTIVVIAGAALRRDPDDPQKRLEPDVWISCSGVLDVEQPKTAGPVAPATPAQGGAPVAAPERGQG